MWWEDEMSNKTRKVRYPRTNDVNLDDRLVKLGCWLVMSVCPRKRPPAQRKKRKGEQTQYECIFRQNRPSLSRGGCLEISLEEESSPLRKRVNGDPLNSRLLKRPFFFSILLSEERSCSLLLSKDSSRSHIFLEQSRFGVCERDFSRWSSILDE